MGDTSKDLRLPMPDYQLFPETRDELKGAIKLLALDFHDKVMKEINATKEYKRNTNHLLIRLVQACTRRSLQSVTQALVV